MGWYAYKLIYQAALSDDPDRGDVILGTMLAAERSRTAEESWITWGMRRWNRLLNFRQNGE